MDVPRRRRLAIARDPSVSADDRVAAALGLEWEDRVDIATTAPGLSIDHRIAIAGHPAALGCEGMAGILSWEHDESDMGARTYDDRAQDATGFLSEYNAWASGEVYGYMLEKSDGEDVDSCWGFYDSKYMWEENILPNLKKGDLVRVEGDASWLAQFLKWPRWVKVIAANDEFDEHPGRGRRLILHLGYDDSPEDPSTRYDGQWTLYQFDSGLAHYQEREEFCPPNETLTRKLMNGTAFWIVEHGDMSRGSGGYSVVKVPEIGRTG